MVTIEQIQEFSDRIAREFHPERIILFGSYAYGTPTVDSDVDLLVVMPYEGKSWRMATEIRGRIRPQFPLDLLVRSDEQIRARVAMGDFFLKEITERGKVLYESNHGGVDSQGGRRHHNGTAGDECAGLTKL